MTRATIAKLSIAAFLLLLAGFWFARYASNRAANDAPMVPHVEGERMR